MIGRRESEGENERGGEMWKWRVSKIVRRKGVKKGRVKIKKRAHRAQWHKSLHRHKQLWRQYNRVNHDKMRVFFNLYGTVLWKDALCPPLVKCHKSLHFFVSFCFKFNISSSRFAPLPTRQCPVAKQFCGEVQGLSSSSLYNVSRVHQTNSHRSWLCTVFANPCPPVRPDWSRHAPASFSLW